MSPAPKRRPPLAVVNTPAPSYKVADVAEVEQAAAAMTKQNLECRDFGHTWRTANIFLKKGHYERQLFCPRCKTNRVQVLGIDGDILDSHYSYQEGYQLKGLGRMLGDGRNALRREVIERMATAGRIKQVTEEEADTKMKKRA